MGHRFPFAEGTFEGPAFMFPALHPLARKRAVMDPPPAKPPHPLSPSWPKLPCCGAHRRPGPAARHTKINRNFSRDHTSPDSRSPQAGTGPERPGRLSRRPGESRGTTTGSPRKPFLDADGSHDRNHYADHMEYRQSARPMDDTVRYIAEFLFLNGHPVNRIILAKSPFDCTVESFKFRGIKARIIGAGQPDEPN